MPQSKKDYLFSTFDNKHGDRCLLLCIITNVLLRCNRRCDELCRCYAHQGSDQCWPRPWWVTVTHVCEILQTQTLHVCRQMLQIRSSCLLITLTSDERGKNNPWGPDRPQTITHRHISSPDDSPYFSTKSWYPRLPLSPTWAACPGNNLESAQHSKQNWNRHNYLLSSICFVYHGPNLNYCTSCLTLCFNGLATSRKTNGLAN